jgi:hypothetical protein
MSLTPAKIPSTDQSDQMRGVDRATARLGRSDRVHRRGDRLAMPASADAAPPVRPCRGADRGRLPWGLWHVPMFDRARRSPCTPTATSIRILHESSRGYCNEHRPHRTLQERRVRQHAPRRYSASRGSSTCSAPSRAPIRGDGVEACFPTFHAKAADQAHITSVPDTTWPVSGHPPDSSRAQHQTPGFDVV